MSVNKYYLVKIVQTKEVTVKIKASTQNEAQHKAVTAATDGNMDLSAFNNYQNKVQAICLIEPDQSGTDYEELM